MLLLSLLNPSSFVLSWRLWYPWWSAGVSSFVELSLARQSYFLLSQFLEISGTSHLSPKLFNCIFFSVSLIILQLLGVKEKRKIDLKKEVIFVGFLFCFHVSNSLNIGLSIPRVYHSAWHSRALGEHGRNEWNQLSVSNSIISSYYTAVFITSFVYTDFTKSFLFESIWR